MSYQSPMLIREPNLKWPLYLLAAIITTILVLLMAGVLRLAQTQPSFRPVAQPVIEGMIRPGAPGFEEAREKVVVEQLKATEGVRSLGDVTVEVSAAIRNTTDRQLNALEARGAVLDAEKRAVAERTVVVVPTKQTVLEPGEAVNVRVLLEGLSPEAERAEVVMEVTGVRFD
ncbi:MAG TPA: hypothetical protein VJS44_12195 [Pyrinomonadaceae bacterium]|nr:hypothetical protein [Pyrinomonadaceae bacterium]